MREVVAGVQPFKLHLVGVGVFPNQRRPSVIWVGIQDKVSLVTMAARLSEGLNRLGFNRERPTFSAHVTLARIKARPPSVLGRLFDDHASTEFQIFNVRAVELMQSELEASGQRYTVLESVTLL